MSTGIRSKCYLNTGTDYATPTWTEIAIIGDLQVDGSWNFAAAQTRETPVERGARTTMPLAISGKMRVQGDNTSFTTFDDAFHDSTKVLDLLILNGDKATNGVTGYRCEFELTKWSEDQATGSVLYKDFELKPSVNTSNLPQRAVVATGAPVFSAIS
jgi:hypothetical protein